MTDRLRSQQAARARPVADLPLESVLARSEELARHWAIALILDRPLEGIGGIPLEELARDAPSLCAQAIRALQSDVELERLTGQGVPTGREQSAPALALRAMTGAHDAPEVVEAVEALRGVLWEALLDELRWPSSERSGARRLADLSDRLAHVCAGMLAAALAAETGPLGGAEDVAVGLAERSSAERHAEAPARRGAVIVDERAQAPVAGTRPDRNQALSRTHPQPRERPISWDESPPSPPGPSRAPERPISWDESPPATARAASADIEIRDERAERGPTAWIGSIGRQLLRFEQDGLPFAVLLLEPLEIERLRRAESSAELLLLADRIEAALAAWSDSLTRESPGRYWLLAPDTDRDAAVRLVERMELAVASAVRHRGAPLELAVGSAVCPDDGREAPALAAHADVGLYAARSAARTGLARRAASVDEPAQ